MRHSNYIRPRQTREMLRKGRYAYHRGTPLNWQAVIDFGYPDIGCELEPIKTFRDIRTRVWNWWAYKRQRGDVQGAFIDWCVWEAPNGKYHVQWLLHVPEHLHKEIERVINNRCEKVLGDLAFDTVDQKLIWNTNGAMKYALEGTEPTYARSIDIRPKDQGTVWGARASGSRALGPAARDAAGRR